MSNREYAHLVGEAFKESKQMAPIQGKNPVVAFFAGFLFGPFGVGIYLKSRADFVMSMAFVIFGTVMTAGVGAPVFWVLCGAWAAKRAASSNHA